MATLTIHHYLDIIDSFVKNVTNTSKSYYFFVGHPYPWLGPDGNIDETAVTVSNGSVYQHESSTYQDIVFGKLLDDNQVAYMIPRYNWVSGEVYDQYDQFEGDLYDLKYYVVTDNMEVYKCIDNNNKAPSTIKPALNITYGTFKTGDGYIWKYMYTVETTANNKFSTANYIPVTQNQDVVNNAIGGTIDVIRMTDGGHDYRTYYSGFLKSVSNNYHVVLDANAAHTDDYYTNSSMYLKAGYGAGQLRKITYYQGLSRTVRVETPFDTFITFNITDQQGNFYVGDTLTQNVDVLASSYFQGSFNQSDNIVQSDTGANGNIISANTTEVRIIRNSPTVEFALDFPYRNTKDNAQQKSGNSTIVSFVELPVVSNTGAFTVGEYVYQRDGAGANIAVGILNSSNITAQFNANTGVISVEDFISIPNNPFKNGEEVLYYTATGNTVLFSLANNTLYYVVQSNTTGVKLSSTVGGANLNITASSIIENGHYLTQTPMVLTIGRSNGQFVVNSTVYTVRGNTSSAVATISNVTLNNEGRKLIYSTNTSWTNFVTDYAVGQFIRVGNDANNNIRRITSVNTSVIGVDLAFSANLVSNTNWLVPTAAEPIGIGKSYSNGTISNTNLNGIILKLADVQDISILGISYFVGETVNMTDNNNSEQGVYATVSFANSSSIVLTDVHGSFQPNYRLAGASSLQIKSIVDVISYPTVTISNPINHFLLGQRIFSRSTVDMNTLNGSANVASFYIVPNELTEYYISPSVTIDGDGENAIAYSIVNDSDYSTNNISSVVVINPGHGYTHANVTITANAMHGVGALHGSKPVISPVLGHGSDSLAELGARYVGITVDIDTGSNENYKYPIYGEYRRVGIIENPLFQDIYVTLNEFDRATLGINISGAGTGTGFTIGEIVYQPNTNYSGVVTFANSSKIEIKNARGDFSYNEAYANGYLSNDNIIGLSSNTYANVLTANVNYFTLSPGVEIISENNSGANGVLDQKISNTYVKLTNVGGRFQTNDIMYDTLSNAYANVTGIYLVNGNIDVSSDFGMKFNQTIRFPLTTNNAAFVQYEYVRQETTNANARVISNNNEFDIKYTDASGAFSADNTLTDQTTLSTGKVIFANSTYLRVTAASGTFANNSIIKNNLNNTALASNVFPVLVMADVSGANKFQIGTKIHGLTSGAAGNCAANDVILYPELIRDSGVVTYLENLEPFELSNTSKENFKLVIKF